VKKIPAIAKIKSPDSIFFTDFSRTIVKCTNNTNSVLKINEKAHERLFFEKVMQTIA